MWLDSKVGTLIGRRNAPKGEVGIEIECEGTNLPNQIGGGDSWNVVGDGSLRNGGLEYVLQAPVPRGRVPYVLDEFKTGIANARLNMSYRTSVHVHVNWLTRSPRHLFNLITLYGILEVMILQWCGPSRAGNLFCLRMTDAEALVKAYRDVVKSENLQTLGTPEIRYASLNLKSLYDHGSVEFRGMRGTTDVALINAWVDFLLSLVDIAEQYKDPTELLGTISLGGADGFREHLREKMGPGLEPLFDEVFDRPDFEQHLYEGIRCLQPMVYSKRNWAESSPARPMEKNLDLGQVDDLMQMVQEMNRRAQGVQFNVHNPE